MTVSQLVSGASYVIYFVAEDGEGNTTPLKYADIPATVYPVSSGSVKSRYTFPEAVVPSANETVIVKVFLSWMAKGIPPR